MTDSRRLQIDCEEFEKKATVDEKGKGGKRKPTKVAKREADDDFEIGRAHV